MPTVVGIIGIHLSGVKILSGSKIVNSTVCLGVKIFEFVDCLNSKIGENSSIGAFSRLLNADIEENYNLFCVYRTCHD